MIAYALWMENRQLLAVYTEPDVATAELAELTAEWQRLVESYPGSEISKHPGSGFWVTEAQAFVPTTLGNWIDYIPEFTPLDFLTFFTLTEVQRR